jgi:hypothetical protein
LAILLAAIAIENFAVADVNHFMNDVEIKKQIYQ